MNIDGLINRYFGGSSPLPAMEMFDNESVYAVYKDIVNMLKMQPDIELGVLQTLSYCFYEILDNVLTHSTKSCGIVVLRKLHSGSHILVSDGKEERTEEAEFWQGTVIYFELYSDKEIDPNDVLENRTDAVSGFNEEFLDSEDIDNLW